MEFFCYHRDRRGARPLPDEMVEAHWAYMDRFAGSMIARGPTLTPNRELPTGSVHIVDLPSPAAARAFAFDEPSYQAGVYRDVMLRRWQNLLGRSMWDFHGGREEGDRFLVLGLAHSSGGTSEPPDDPSELISFGPLLSDDGGSWLGTAALVRASDADVARSVLVAELYAEIEVHAWQFGGRQ